MYYASRTCKCVKNFIKKFQESRSDDNRVSTKGCQSTNNFLVKLCTNEFKIQLSLRAISRNCHHLLLVYLLADDEDIKKFKVHGWRDLMKYACGCACPRDGASFKETSLSDVWGHLIRSPRAIQLCEGVWSGWEISGGIRGQASLICCNFSLFCNSMVGRKSRECAPSFPHFYFQVE